MPPLCITYVLKVVVEQGFAGIMLGVANKTVTLNTQLGSDKGGWAFTGGITDDHYIMKDPAMAHSQSCIDNSGWTFHAGRWTNFPAFERGDKVGIRLYLKNETETEMACYKNGQFLGVAFSGSRTPFTFPLVPAVCLWKEGDRVRLFPESFVVERIA